MNPPLQDVFFNLPLFVDLEESGRALLAGGAAESRLPAGHVIIREGDPGRQLFVIRSGKVQVYLETPDGAVELNVLCDGAFFGEMSILEEMPRSASVRAVTDVSLILLPRVGFQLLLERYPAQYATMVTHLARDLSYRLRRLGDEFARQH